MGKRHGMTLEENVQEEYINTVRNALAKAFDEIGLQQGFRRDRLLHEMTEEVCLSTM